MKIALPIPTRHFQLLATMFCAAALAGGVGPANAAGLLDAVFGKGEAGPGAAESGQRLWRIGEFTSIALAPREPGSPENKTPITVSHELLQQQLGQIRYSVGTGEQPLFAASEVSELAKPLSQALAQAGPANDLLLVSASRRDGGLLAAPIAVTARLFVHDGMLQIIVHDARFEFYDRYRGTQQNPSFEFGSRSKAGPVQIKSAGGSNRRADWLSLPLQQQAQTVSGDAAAGAAMRNPSAGQQQPAAQNPAESDIERRLIILQRLHERKLISEDEYRQKRQEILKQL